MVNCNNKFIISSILAGFLFFNVSLAKEPVDSEISKEFNLLLNQEADLPKERVKILVKDRVLVLEGTLDTRLQADKLVELAHSVNNIKDVDTYNLKVVNSKQYFKDALLTSAVKGKILLLTRNNKIDKNDIHVETTNGCVHLFGIIRNSEDLSVIKRELNRIKGVKSVDCTFDTKETS